MWVGLMSTKKIDPGAIIQGTFAELHAGRLFLSARGPSGPNIIVCGLLGPEILAGFPAMTTETMFLIVTRYQLRNTYVNGTLLVSTYLCLQKLTPIKGFP